MEPSDNFKRRLIVVIAVINDPDVYLHMVYNIIKVNLISGALIVYTSNGIIIMALF